MSFSNDIKAVRHRCLLSQQDFAKELGVSFATVNRWESGRSKPNFKTKKLIREFCIARGIDLDLNTDLLEEPNEIQCN